MYIKALDQGFFTLGAPHDEGDGPAPEEILTSVPAGSDKVAFKSGYGKYLGVDSKGRVTGIADAVGPLEKWEPVFQVSHFDTLIFPMKLHKLNFVLFNNFRMEKLLFYLQMAVLLVWMRKTMLLPGVLKLVMMK